MLGNGFVVLLSILNAMWLESQRDRENPGRERKNQVTPRAASPASGTNASPAARANLYERVGGHAGLEAFVDRFNAVMASDPAVRRIWSWHAPDIAELKERLVAFLSGFAGGPPLYPRLYRPPMIRARHLKFRIGAEERDMWLKCAFAALKESIADPETRGEFGYRFTAFAEHMRNRDDDGQRTGAVCEAAG